MKKIREAWMKWFLREDGQAVVEYGAMLTLMLALLFIMRAVGFEANTLFHWVVSALQ
jgi:Flp pilus assembly pilin Flp